MDETDRERNFKSLAEVQAAVGQERGSIQVDYQDPVRASSPVREGVQRLYKPEDYDFSPAPGSALTDAGKRLPSINDSYQGKAPDIGAFEADAAPKQVAPGGMQAAKHQGLGGEGEHWI